jgi:hypothetical protein
MKRVFENISRPRIKKSAFDLSHERKMSMDMGDLVPALLKEVVPGDEFNVSTEALVRLAPLVAPMMHRVNVFMHYFYVPNRLVWSEWDNFINGGADVTVANPTFPTFDLTVADKDDLAKGTLADYLGVPTSDGVSWGGATLKLNALPFRGYYAIWDRYYRDQHLQQGDSSWEVTNWSNVNYIRKRAWEKDYFTSAAPTAQRGDEIMAPLTIDYLDQSIVKQDDGSAPVNSADLVTGTGAASDDLYATTDAARIENLDPAETGIKMSELRKAEALQRFWELMMRGGSRMKEYLYNMFGVYASDQRLNDPEYLGGWMNNVMISEVLDTAGDAATASKSVGDMAGHGISLGKRQGFRKKFKEHGFVFGIMSVLPRTAYQQNLERHWFKDDRFDYLTPQLAHIGEQAIYKKELVHDMSVTAVRDAHDDVFGYGPRYGEYKQSFDSVHGDFKDNLDHWHMGRKLSTAAAPVLNENFIQADPTKRVFAVDDGTHSLWCQIYHQIHAIRPLPYFTDPKLA